MQPPFETAIATPIEAQPEIEPSTDHAPTLNALLDALQAMRSGDFTVRLPGNQTGLQGKVADAFNDIVAANQRMSQQLERVGEVVGREGKTRTRVRFGLSNGA